MLNKIAEVLPLYKFIKANLQNIKYALIIDYQLINKTALGQ